MLFKLSNLNSNLALTLGYLNPALNNSAQNPGKFFSRNPESSGYGIRNTAGEIRNPTNGWNSESKFHDQDWNSVPRILNSGRGIQNLRLSWMPLHGAISVSSAELFFQGGPL